MAALGRQWLLVSIALWLLVIGSAVAVVNVTHLNRQTFARWQKLQVEKQQLEVRWQQLLLEESTWATHSRVAQVAQKKLGMELPKAADVIVVRP
ncbi:cell division protein FtsL [Pelagibaculum spongiae]|uniref:Cell division protein FtsL n=1 Tax=Pelagibaculum spongiae TaxID=2080658 RepID=A0A2V1H3S5_9GAMM|nr:cell division protein FtsL [Pelagibaculum spongiae]PVZ71878.1 cell division protein FtsL [Pelagibaculum spongiae]